MATVLRVELIPERRRWSVSDKFEFTVRDYYRIVCNSAVNSYIGILSQAQTVGPNPLPLIGAEYEGPDGTFDTLTYIRGYEGYLDDNPERWIVEVTAGPDTADQDKEAEDPLDEAPVISWGGTDVQQAVQKDINGDALTNSFPEPWDPPLQRRGGFQTLTIEQNVDDFDNEQAAPAPKGLRFTWNQDPIWGYDVGQVLLVSITAQSARKNGVNYWRRVLSFEIDTSEDGFGYQGTETQLDRGWRYKTNSGEPSDFDPAAAGGRLQKPILLDGAGHLLNGSGKPADPTDVHYRDAKLYGPGDWSGLNLPDDVTTP